jgi:hypothetical protein
VGPDKIALSFNYQRLGFDDELLNSLSYAAISSIVIDDLYVAQIWAGLAERLTDKEPAELIHTRIAAARDDPDELDLHLFVFGQLVPRSRR